MASAPDAAVGRPLCGRRSGLAARLGLFAFASSFLTATVVSLLALSSVHADLRRELHARLPALLSATEQRLTPWLEERRAEPSVDPDVLASVLEPADLPPGARLFLLDGQGRALARSRNADPAALPGPLSLARSPSGRVAEYANDSGAEVVGSRRPLERAGWQLLVEQPRPLAYAPLASAARRLLLADLIVIGFFGVLARRLTRTILGPIRELSQGARRISRGEFAVQIPRERDDEIGLLVRAFNDMSRTLLEGRREIEEANDRLQLRNLELQAANEVLEQLSITDGLTKLHNHRFFQDTLTREIKRARRSGEPLSMLLIDIDDFKQLNDRLGHAAGDQLLAAIARLLSESVRESDLVARYGGEEFAVITSNTPLGGAVQLADKARQAVARASFTLDDSMQAAQVTVSIGVAQYGGDRKAFFGGADQALYQAKAAGKNRVVAAEAIRLTVADALSA